MVRVAVGSMVDVAQGRMTLEEFAAGLASGERRRMGQTAPARGLALVAVALLSGARIAGAAAAAAAADAGLTRRGTLDRSSASRRRAAGGRRRLPPSSSRASPSITCFLPPLARHLR